MANNSDDLMFEYLLQMGGMQPEMQDLKRKQQMIDALRDRANEPLRGQMVGKYYVAPSPLQGLGQLGQAALANYQQNNLDSKYFNKGYNPDLAPGEGNMPGIYQRQQEMLRELRRRRMTPEEPELLNSFY